MASLKCNGCDSSSTALKFVSCLHTLCETCLQNSISFDGSIKCPKCLSITALPVGVEPLRSLPNVVRRGESVAGDETQGQPVCEECGDDTIATSGCENCQVKMCDVHAGAHPIFKATKGHIVKPLSVSQVEQASSSAGSTSRSATKHRCVLHTSEFINGFCVQCNQLLCPKCKQAHSHKRDHQVLDIARAGQKTRDLLADKLGSSSSTCDGIISQALSNVQTNIQKLNDQTEQASAKVNQFFKLLIEAVEKRQNDLLAELDDIRSKKTLSLEKQQCRLQECLSQAESASDIVKSFTNDVELLRIWTWVDESLNKVMRTAEEDKVPCVSSGLVFASTDITQLLNDIGKSGAVLDVADHAVLDCPDKSMTHDDVILTVCMTSSPDAVPASATTTPSYSVSQDHLDNIGLEISVCNLDVDDFPSVRTRCESLPGRVEIGHDRLAAGRYSVSAMIGNRHIQGSPQQLIVASTPIRPLFDNSRCGSGLKITNDGRTLSKGGGSWSSACTTPMVTDTGSSTLKVTIDKTGYGDIFLSACSSSNPKLEQYQQEKSQCFGWNSRRYDAGHHTGTALDRRWQTGDIILLTVDHDRHTLTGRHERTGATETIPNVTGNLYWIVALDDLGDQVSLE
ncbi:E3 ubiquitin-protein ligase TRIM71-like [Sycon ciliatum]|uniref:E3 ubiquitin-protein ligase TRIM71-like n=1 Tax=Sycon ciliatum TaxID=27933 RepID=UPI0031F6596D